jgi:hypothetical protein
MQIAEEVEKPHHVKLYGKYTILSKTELYRKPNVTSTVLCYIPKGMIVYHNGEPDYIRNYSWSEVLYDHNGEKIVGWIPSFLIEPYTPSLDSYNIVSTERLLDISGKPNFYNMGERTVLFVTGNYQMKPEFKTKQDVEGKSTLLEIEGMLHEFEGYPEKFLRVQKALTYPNGKFLFTPYKLMDYSRASMIVLSCAMDRTFGRLSSYGVRGWIVLKSVTPEARTGTVKVYNSANNCIETYSWGELVASVGNRPQGILVPK